jgi:hypothetical protein
MGCPHCPDHRPPAATERPSVQGAPLPPGQTGYVVYDGGPPQTPMVTVRNIIPQREGMPVVDNEGAIEYPIDRDPPQLLEGYERKSSNPWRLVPVWSPCQLRMYAVSTREDCNCVNISGVCNHPASEHFTQVVTHAGCQACAVRMPINGR